MQGLTVVALQREIHLQITPLMSFALVLYITSTCTQPVGYTIMIVIDSRRIEHPLLLNLPHTG
jgi:hypothetical protein